VKIGGVFVSRPYGSYLVISTKHVSTSDCNYTNVFKAIPAGVKTLPKPEVKTPQAYPELARVISNEDPDGKGRVQVQTQWQKEAEGLSTSWVRVMTPNAGSSGAVSKNRGFMFIPEPDDEIILGYRYGDPSRPFVMGSIYNGMTGAGGDVNNKIKSLGTRVGSAITFNDDENAGNVVINDPSGNMVVMDDAGNVVISAPNSIVLNATDIIMNAGNSVQINAMPNKDGSGEGTFTLIAKKDIIAASEEESVTIKAQMEMNIVSEDVTNLSSGCTTNIGAETIKMVGASETIIDGEKVKINS